MTRRRDGLRRAARSATLLLVAALLLLVAGGPAAAAATRVAPADDYAGRLEFDVATVDPVLVTTAGPTSVTVTGTVTNTGAEPITDLIYRFQRGPAVTSTAELQRELDEPSEPTAAVPPRFSELLDRLDPGQSAPFTATVPLTGTGGIGVQSPGVYPLLLNVNGDVALEAGPLPARVGELHLVLPVLGIPGESPPAAGAGGETVQPLGVSVLWPLIDSPHLAVGGVFRNDDLATSIAPGGRLAILLDGLTDASAAALPAGSVTVVLDPQLLDELDRMSRGYQVLTGPQTALALTAPDQTGATAAGTSSPDTTSPDATSPDATSPDTGTPQTTSLSTTAAGPLNGTAPTAGSTPPTSVNAAPTSTSGSPSADQVGVAGNAVATGTGSAAAAVYLQRLRSVVGRYPTVLLPLADPDAVSLTRNGLGDDVAATTASGREIATRVLGGEATARLSTTTAYPAQGLLDGPTADVLTAAGFSGAVLSASGIGDPSADDGRSTAVTLTGTDGADLGLRAAVAQAGGLGDLALLAGQESGRNWSIRVNALTGLLYQQVKDDAAGAGSSSDRNPPGTVIVPNRQWSPSLASLQRLQETLTTLGRGGLITGVDLGTVLGRATASAPLDYPDSARSDELDPAYLDKVRAAREEIGQLRSAFGDQPQSQDPGPVLDALDASLLTAGSTAYRTQFAGAEANLATVRSTLDELHAGVRIATSGATYTLASSSSPLLVTVQNTLPYDVTVTVRIVGGEYVGLDATAPDPQVVPAGRSVPFRIATEVSRSGQFQVSAQVVGADGAVWGETVPLSVQSSAFGALTVVIIAVAGAVLLVMVVLRVRQRMQLRRARIAAQAAGLPWPPVGSDQGGDPVLGEVRR